MRLVTVTVTPTDEGKTVKYLLRARLHLSSSLLKSLKWRSGAILRNGQPTTVAAVVRAGDVLTVDVSDTRPLSAHIVPVDMSLDILYEDEDLLILNKPAGIAVHSAALTQETVTVAGAVAHYLHGAPFHPVNRLDRGVTGIMVVAKSGYLHERCMAILHTDDFHREYLGICRGVPDPASGTIALPIGRDPDSVLKRRIDPQGLPASTAYAVEAVCGGYTLLRLRPLTGRTHQLRLHCAAMGHALVGDWLYGREEPAVIDRPALHSHELWLRHPLSGEPLHIISSLPADMARLLAPSGQ